MYDILEILFIIVAIFASFTICVAFVGACVWIKKEMSR